MTTTEPTARKRTAPTSCCSHQDSLRRSCQRQGRYQMVGLRGVRGSFCQQHAELNLGRALTSIEKA